MTLLLKVDQASLRASVFPVHQAARTMEMEESWTHTNPTRLTTSNTISLTIIIHSNNSQGT